MPTKSVSIKDDKKESSFKDSWKVPARYDLRQLLGSGAYGSVCEAKDLDQGRKVAIKQNRNLMEDLVDCKRILREVCILSHLDHKYCVKLYDLIVPVDLKRFNEIYVVLEICDSDFRKLLRTDVNLTRLHVTTLLYNLLVGVNYLHSLGIWHRDLKPANCLVNEDCSVKICDFGLARAVGVSSLAMELQEVEKQGEKRNLTGHVVTRWYRAPELILLQENYTQAIDIWSVGCIYAELLGMMEGTSYRDRSPLFPGSTCFPLSPHAAHQHDAKFYAGKGARDQLMLICKLLGSPSEEDIEQIEGADARAYVRCFPKCEGMGLKVQFAGQEKLGCDLLEQMLVFNPAKRIAVQDSLEHELFTKVRDRSSETVASAPITLDFEDEKGLDEKQLRDLFLREIRKFHPEMP